MLAKGNANLSIKKNCSTETFTRVHSVFSI